MTATLACLGLVAFGAVIGALSQAWVDRKLLSVARSIFWRTKRVSIATQHWADTAQQAKDATERLKSIADDQQERAQRAWAEAAEHEARAEAHFYRAQAIYQEFA